MALISIDPNNYDNQLSVKLNTFTSKFSEFDIDDIEVYRSKKEHYRMRAEFRLWHEDDSLDYIMFEKNNRKKRFFVKNFNIASETIYDLMHPFLNAVNDIPMLKTRLYQVEFLSSSIGQCLVSMIYHKRLCDEWQEAAIKLKEKFNVEIIGRSRKQKIVLDHDYIYESFDVAGTSYKYQQVENCFTQPNASTCEQMLNWAVENSTEFGDDLLELYCGNGNFTIPLSKNFNKVLATEIAKASVKSAEHNFELNNISTIKIGRLSSEELTEAMAKKRAFFRLKDIDLDVYNFSTVFVDPPRAGIDDLT